MRSLETTPCLLIFLSRKLWVSCLNVSMSSLSQCQITFYQEVIFKCLFQFFLILTSDFLSVGKAIHVLILSQIDFDIAF